MPAKAFQWICAGGGCREAIPAPTDDTEPYNPYCPGCTRANEWKERQRIEKTVAMLSIE